MIFLASSYCILYSLKSSGTGAIVDDPEFNLGISHLTTSCSKDSQEKNSDPEIRDQPSLLTDRIGFNCRRPFRERSPRRPFSGFSFLRGFNGPPDAPVVKSTHAPA